MKLIIPLRMKLAGDFLFKDLVVLRYVPFKPTCIFKKFVEICFMT